MKQHFLLTEAAKLVGVRGYQIAYRITNGDIPEPTLRVNNKRVFTAEDIEGLKKFFGPKRSTSKKGGT